MKQAKLTIGGTEYAVTLQQTQYRDGNVAVEAIDATDGSPFCMVSVNLPESKWLAPGTWYGKHWSENEGFLQQLMGQGVIEEVPCVPAQSGFVDNIRAYRLK